MRFSKQRKYVGEERLTRDELDRRGVAVREAQQAFESVQEAIGFLNAPNGSLGGRPLDLATQSDAGLQAVRQAIHAHASGGGGR